MRLKIELFRYGTMVFGKVLEQDEELRYTSDCGKDVIVKSGNWAIESQAAPCLGRNVLSIRGYIKSLDNEILLKIYDSEDEAKEACAKIKELVNKINNSDYKKPLGMVERIL